jgi:peptide/nickel transport system ATP-binding protein
LITAGSEMSLLSIQKLCVEIKTNFQNKVILDNISFNLDQGEVVGVVGESGSGKTVTALSILQLLPQNMKVTDGSIHFSGKNGQTDLTQLGSGEIRKIRGSSISMIFQEPMTSLNPVHTCGQQVREALQQHTELSKKETKSRTVDLFDEVDLPDPARIIHKYPHELSGGQRQRVMIAMALAGNPQLLIADEPTTALDVTIQKNILQLLDKIRKNRSMGILFISHDLGVVKKISDQVVVMYQGKIIESGSAHQVLNYPKEAYTKGLIACRPKLEYADGPLLTVSDFMDPDKTSIDQKKSQEIISNPDYKSPPIFSIHDLSVRYKQRAGIIFSGNSTLTAVKHLSFNIYPGETLGLIGESGSGKSTIGKSIIQLVQSYSGQIMFHGKSLQEMKARDMKKFRKKVQMIFQDPYSSLNPRLRIGDAIGEGMLVHQLYKGKKERTGKVMELLENVGLQSSHYYRYPHEFSGGQRQRIGIARALSTEPELLICDESVSSLDVSVQAQVLNLLNDLKGLFNLTYLFISHDLAVVKYMSDRIIVIQDGELIESGNTEEIYKNPEADYTKSLIDSILD